MTDLQAVCRGELEPDLVIENARVFSAHTREWLDGDVAIAGERFAGIGRYEGGERIDAGGRCLVPGYIDAHLHIESSKLMLDEFARVVLGRGTTTVVCDPHELANVLGAPGIEWLIEATAGLPLDVFCMASSCVPASPFESPGASLDVADLERLLAHPRVLGVAEMMNFPAVIAGDPRELAKIALAGHVDGHAPAVSGRELDAYLATGIATDHEATTPAEALERLRRGCYVLIREASNARNLRALLQVVREHGPSFCAFCTDDREPDFLVREGHIDQMCRVAVAEGIAPEDALVMATLHPALCHGLSRRGAIAPGYLADCLLLDDLGSFTPSLVIKSGRRVAEIPRVDAPAWTRGTVKLAPLAPDQLATPREGMLRVIGMVPDQILTRSLELPAATPGLATVCVVERHRASGRIGLGKVLGFGLAQGAFATTVAHDAHNVVCVGRDETSMVRCIERLGELGGGIVVARDGAVVGELALPIAGLLSERPASEVVELLDRLQDELTRMGVTLPSPFMAASFLALSVIPRLKITDRGLVDVDRFELVPLAVGAPMPDSSA